MICGTLEDRRKNNLDNCHGKSVSAYRRKRSLESISRRTLPSILENTLNGKKEKNVFRVARVCYCYSKVAISTQSLHFWPGLPQRADTAFEILHRISVDERWLIFFRWRKAAGNSHYSFISRFKTSLASQPVLWFSIHPLESLHRVSSFHCFIKERPPVIWHRAAIISIWEWPRLKILLHFAMDCSMRIGNPFNKHKTIDHEGNGS